ncbi:MAG TPA: ribbon-helix-helix domain-containing protein [Rhodothermales bacterium]|nr:ribbon-helix-helix domain-containing protein [Rhodothermales bacterium]
MLKTNTVLSGHFDRLFVMRETVSISLPEEIKSALDEAVAEDGVSRSDLVRQAVQDFLFVRQFRRLRRELILYAEAQGIYSDEDVFRRIS